jgi:hypothetical protein
MSKIVVSYRRSDSQAIAGRIVDRLIAQFGEQSVFMDVDNIPFGIDFRQHIQSVLAQAEVLIAVVGPDWLARVRTAAVVSGRRMIRSGSRSRRHCGRRSW